MESTSNSKNQLVLANNDEKPSTSKATELVLRPNRQVKLSSENRPIKVRKQPRVVLDEDDFTRDLERIIERDYFPEVPKLRAQQEYMDAVENNDVERIRELQFRYATNYTNGKAPKTIRKFNLNEGRFDVDTEMEEVIVNPDGQNDVDKNAASNNVDIEKHSVQSFVDTYISEDSQSFHELMNYENKKHKSRFDWIYKAEARHNRELIDRSKPMIAAADEQLLESRQSNDPPLDIDNWEYKARNSVIFGPEAAPPTVKEYMDAVKNSGHKIVNKAGTRIDTDSLNWSNKKAASHQFAVNKVDVSGVEIAPAAPSHGHFQPIATPNPVVGPGDSPFITWGQIDGTPFRLDASDMTPVPDSGPVFKLPSMTKREVIAHDMVDKLKKQNREKKLFSQKMTEKLKDPNTRMSTGTRMSMMSPAATKFASSKLGIRTRNTGTLGTKSPPSLRLPSARSTTTSDQLRTPISSIPSDVKLEPMESVINKNLLSIRKRKSNFD